MRRTPSRKLQTCIPDLCYPIIISLITSLKHDFRAGYSCETQLIKTVHDLLAKTDPGTQLDMAILDFSKFFDSGRLPPKRCLQTVRMILTDRSMKVVSLEVEESVAGPVDSLVITIKVLWCVRYFLFATSTTARSRSSP
ncbi:hypothetical protein MAR_010776, partial [Mya arenaria]